jgi:putative SOS response-associated peptidase YedK
MCNLYSLTKGQSAVRAFTKAMRDSSGNQPSLPGIFPDQMAPVVHVAADSVRELTTMLWGFPPLDKPGAKPITNVRNLGSSYWRGWLKPEWRCLVPATSFCEYDDANAKRPTWFALDETRPLFAFAGVWRPWRGERKNSAGEHRLFAFLTCAANDVVRPVHAKAMPVVLTTPAACDAWLTGTMEEAIALQRPLPPAELRVVATGRRADEGGAASAA